MSCILDDVVSTLVIKKLVTELPVFILLLERGL